MLKPTSNVSSIFIRSVDLFLSPDCNILFSDAAKHMK